MRGPDLRTTARRLEGSFPGRCLRQFVAIQGLDRAVVLSSQTFTTLIPLLLLVSALAPAGRRDVVARAIIRRFELRGDSADAVEALFAHAGAASLGVASASLLLFSGFSLARRIQRMYLQAWRLDAAPGVGHAIDAALGLAVLVAGIAVLSGARALAGPGLQVPASLVAGLVVWTTLPWLLLHRRIGWRRLVPGGALTAVGTSVYGAASTVYMPPLLESYSERYGLFGVTLALIGWLLAIALVVVASTAVASEFDRFEAPWARRVRRGLRVPAGAGRQAPGAGPSGSGLAGY
ncbi:YhjD/YihY/BrkB family envelope integrity protein [Blastococcus sp. SYSU D00922]